MTSNYDKVDPWNEKCKRLYNCSSLREDDCMYINYQFERYKTRNFNIVALAGFMLFGVSAIARKFSPSPVKYYTTCLFVSGSFWSFMV